MGEGMLDECERLFANGDGEVLIADIGSTLISSMAAVNIGRRQEARSAVLIAARRAAANPPSAEMLAKVSNAWNEALVVFRAFTALLTPAAIQELDDLVARVDDPTEPSAEILRAVIVNGMGFSEAEYAWALDELAKAGYRPLALLSEGDPAVLESLVHATASGASGIRPIGFATMSSSSEANDHVAAAICRARAAGMTASLFHMLPAMVLFAARQAPEGSALFRLGQRAGEKSALFH